MTRSTQLGVGVAACLLFIVSSGCCGSGGSSSGSSGGSSSATARVTNATFAKGLTENMQAQGPTTEFLPHEKINISVTFAGRPRKGVVKAQFFHREAPIADASTDFGQANKGLYFSIGGSTYVGFWLNHENPLPISNAYKVVVTVDGNPAGTYAFRVSPPPDAIPSKVHSAILAKGMTAERLPIEPSTTFGPTDIVHLLGRLDLGNLSWIEVNWYANNQIIASATKSLTAERNIPNEAFFFTARPDGGWPPGQHKAVLILNDNPVGEYPFTVVGGMPGAIPVMPSPVPGMPGYPPGQVPMPPGGYPPGAMPQPGMPAPPAAPPPPTGSY